MKLVLQSWIPTPSALSQEPISKPVTGSILFQKYMALHWPCLITSLLTISLLCVQERSSLVKLLTQVSVPGLISGSLFSSLPSSVRGFSEKTHQNGWALCIFYQHFNSTMKKIFLLLRSTEMTTIQLWGADSVIDQQYTPVTILKFPLGLGDTQFVGVNCVSESVTQMWGFKMRECFTS